MNKIIVAAHKEYEMPQNELYLPVQAGAACHERLPYTGDDTGENISEKNGLYCEMTALYWGWKNLETEALGLCHYRRYFREPGKKEPLQEKTLKELLRDVPVILPKKRHYWIETGESQYVHAHGSESLTVLKNVLQDLCPDYLPAFDASMVKTAGHRFNMMIMKKEQLDAYCEWLFDVLFETERRMAKPEARIMGFLSERLLDAWIMTTGTAYLELPLYLTEKTNWLKKGSAFLMRKFGAGGR